MRMSFDSLAPWLTCSFTSIRLVLLFLAVTSAASAELVAVSSLFTCETFARHQSRTNLTSHFRRRVPSLH